MSAYLTSDWAVPRSGAAFTGYTGNPAQDGTGGPSGTLLLCVANTPIPCRSECMGVQKFVQFTVINVRKKGWSYAPWCVPKSAAPRKDISETSDAFCAGRKKPTGKNAKAVKDDNTKELFENGEWARNDVTMERVGKSVIMYSFVKDGQGKGERLDGSVSVVSAGQTFRVRLQDFMYEEKKGGINVFPHDVEIIPVFSVVEIMVTPANQGGFEQGYGLSLARVRPCDFTLYSLCGPLGLGLLPTTYTASLEFAEGFRELNPGLKRVLEEKNTGFFGRVTQGSYFIRYKDDFRLVGPKENPTDPQSRHLDVMQGGVFAIDVHRDDLIRFTNACEAEEADSLLYAQFTVELAAAAGALDCYVVYNEFLLRHDPNRSPFTGVPVLDTQKLLDFVKAEDLVESKRIPLPFDFSPQVQPFIALDCIVEEEEESQGKSRSCDDLVIASENATGIRRSYRLVIGEQEEEDIMRFLFVPKTTGGSACGSMSGRQDYRLLKRRKPN